MSLGQVVSEKRVNGWGLRREDLSERTAADLREADALHNTRATEATWLAARVGHQGGLTNSERCVRRQLHVRRWRRMATQTPPRDLEGLVRSEREVGNACAALWGGAAGCCFDARTGDACR